ncbi:hypothetical protein DBR45_01195 [Pseudomonas sp. HMWF031]|nr:hypothetical protein DBR45_01195 [Pseudomonas sp. HMWF031]
MTHHGPNVGASLLAMIVNDNAGYLVKRVVQKSIASGLAPTGIFVVFEVLVTPNSQPGPTPDLQ